LRVLAERHFAATSVIQQVAFMPRTDAVNYAVRHPSLALYPTGPARDHLPDGLRLHGEVYRTRDTRLDRIVAFKILPEHLSSNPQLCERFEREARALSRLSHPHICPLYDVANGTASIIW